ncbi:glycosyltransferase family 9 protein [Candidatus Rariloculus sp.]|uniref:glycosyltransferase family 9 protein n=1 Tax=Candidatus Rariloculus sp. TaxID=3101265 RepID=UPI003D0E856E
MSLIPESPPSHLCIIRLSAIGDTCHTVPVVRAIQRAWPGTEITWIVGRVEHELLRGLEGVKFAVLDKSLGWRAYARLRSTLERRKFPLLLHMHASTRANLASLVVTAPLRLGFDRARARDGQHYFCNRHLKARARRHVMDGLFEFAEALGTERGELRWDIPIDPADREFAGRHVDPGAPTLVISPCSGQRFRNYRNWRAERYAAIADHAHSRYGAKILLTGGSTELERSYGATIARQAKCAPKNLIGETSLKQLLAILERAAVVVCPDSGPAHMATSVRTPVVGLYATSNRFRTGPYLSQHLVADSYPDAVRREFGVPVDAIRFGRRVRNPEAMDLITVADVVAKLDLAFAELGIDPPGG